MTARRIRFLAVLATLGAALGAATTGPPPAHADPLPPSCETHPWGFLGLTKVRIICDDPIQPDGSWMRARIIGVPAHYEPETTSCSGGEYYSRCTTYPGGWVDAQIDSNETYRVTPATVLPDEPGHMPDPAPVAQSVA